MKWTSAVCLAISMAFISSPATAEFLTIENPSFEANVLGENGFISSAVGWLTPGDSGTFNPAPAIYPGGIPDGDNVAYSSAGGPVISQVLTDVLEADLEYELTVWVGNRVGTGFSGYLIELVAGGTVIASDNNTLAPSDGEFLQSSITYTPDDTDPLLGEALEIRMRSFGQQANFDDVMLSAVPEPGAFAALALTAVGLLTRRRRRS